MEGQYILELNKYRKHLNVYPVCKKADGYKILNNENLISQIENKHNWNLKNNCSGN